MIQIRMMRRVAMVLEAWLARRWRTKGTSARGVSIASLMEEEVELRELVLGGRGSFLFLEQLSCGFLIKAK